MLQHFIKCFYLTKNKVVCFVIKHTTLFCFHPLILHRTYFVFLGLKYTDYQYHITPNEQGINCGPLLLANKL